ncbi:hypothetical protein BA768_12925 [Chryseobacterium sp. CBo1]|uniref:ATP-dependent DNA helicase n=1 Tax=Chryseobacterium sp. CBo1 TaxID=1869230 RepID=UPI000810791B|nr:AAA family ATPase [Chryseobacterium sp. CBo1]OCK52250.1 hypothetical protein BA768_12925 [Chryseobacterium sp. CBo1]
MANYDINDPYDIDIMKMNFDDFNSEDWESYIEIAKEKKLGFDKIAILMNAKKNTRGSRKLSPKQLVVILSLMEKIDEMLEDDNKSEKATELFENDTFNMAVSHATFRVAWHDNKWNGSICNNPETNTYCNGFHSLLSERIRKRKEENMVEEIAHKGKKLNEIDYLPPCFWSINLFGNESIKVKHDNPAAPNLELLEDDLPKHSMLSWPFSVSFGRTAKEVAESGAYPKNLEEVRIPRFNAKMHEGKSIAFMYAKFSNPITEEEQQYLVVGAGIIDSKEKASEIKHFGPEEVIEQIRKRPQSNFKYRNFPSMNWAMRFSFDDYTSIRMPYHEYLDEAEKLASDAKDNFLDNIKVAITESELEWCFKYVAMDIGDDEAIYILTKMRKALLVCKDDGIVARDEMLEKIAKVDELLKFAWDSRSYFPGFTSLARVFLNQEEEPEFELNTFYSDFKEESENPDTELENIIQNPSSFEISKRYSKHIVELQERLKQRNFSTKEFLTLSMLNLKPFQFSRILSGKLKLSDNWIRNFDDDVKSSHKVKEIIENPYLLYEDYDYWQDSHDDVYGEELDSPIDLFKIDIAFFPHSKYKQRIDLQKTMEFVDKRRIRALVLRYLNTLENKGDCFTDATHLEKAMRSYPLYYELNKEYSLPEGFFHPISSDFSNHFQEEPKKIILVEENDTTYFYLAKVYNAEKNVEEKIMSLLRASDHNEKFDAINMYIDNSITNLQKSIGDNFEVEIFKDERQNLYRNVFRKRFFIIAGNAGSGKSHEILNVIKHLEEHENQKYLLLAPTGKAALRLSKENVIASTIDKFISDVRNKKIRVSELKEIKNLIIDETSMVDLLKFEKLLNIFNFKEPSFKRLILIGDPNQLPAIGYGRILEDCISFLRTHGDYKNNFIQLESNCRSELKDNDILKLADAFKQKGEFDPQLLAKFKNKETFISEGFNARYWTTKEELYDQIEEEFQRLSNKEKLTGTNTELLNCLLGFDENGEIKGEKLNLENFQILSPYNGQFSGTSKINDYIQRIFRKDLKLEFRKGQYKKADKLIRTQNYYNNKALLLSNGTMGFIDNSRNESFYYENKDGIDNIPFYDIRANEKEAFELAYAISIHKSQGSGFNHLFLVLPARYGLLNKELVYTALTRTKKTITIFLQTNDEKLNTVLEIAQSRSNSASRRTSLLLDKPFRFYDLEPEPNVYVESRVELLIYHLLMKKREEFGIDHFNFAYESKPFINGKEINIKTDFTIYTENKIWYWEHLGLLGQGKYEWTWQNLKKKTYQEAGIWEQIITTDESNGINPAKIDCLINLIVEDTVETEDKHKQYSNHHYYIR